MQMELNKRAAVGEEVTEEGEDARGPKRGGVETAPQWTHHVRPAEVRADACQCQVWEIDGVRGGVGGRGGARETARSNGRATVAAWG